MLAGIDGHRPTLTTTTSTATAGRHSKKGETPGPIAETLKGSKTPSQEMQKKRNCKKRKTAMGPPRALTPREEKKCYIDFECNPPATSAWMYETSGGCCVWHHSSSFLSLSCRQPSWINLARLTLLPLTRNVVVSTTSCTSRSRHPRRSRSSEAVARTTSLFTV